GQHGGVEDIETVDLLDIGTCDAPSQSLFANFVEQRFAPGLAELLGVVETGDGAPWIENHSGGDHGTTERSTTHLIDAGNQLFDQREIESQLHQPASTSSRTA